MTISKTRTKHSEQFKAKVALEALREQSSIAELSKRHGLHQNQIYNWKKQLLDGAAGIFSRGAAGHQQEDTHQQDVLLKKIGQLTVERDFLERGLRIVGR